MAPNTTCVRCNKRPKRKDHQFCSDRCTKIAAKNAPSLLRVPKGHVMYDDRQSLSHLIHASVDLTPQKKHNSEEVVQEAMERENAAADVLGRIPHHMDAQVAHRVREVPVTALTSMHGGRLTRPLCVQRQGGEAAQAEEQGGEAVARGEARVSSRGRQEQETVQAQGVPPVSSDTQPVRRDAKVQTRAGEEEGKVSAGVAAACPPLTNMCLPCRRGVRFGGGIYLSPTSNRSVCSRGTPTVSFLPR